MVECVNIVIIIRHPSLFHPREGWFLCLSFGRSTFLLLPGKYSYTSWECLYRSFLTTYNIKNRILKFCYFFSTFILNLFDTFYFRHYFRITLHSKFNIIVSKVVLMYRVATGYGDFLNT